MNKRSWFFYGWVIIAVSFISVAIGYGIRYSFPVFFVTILEEFGRSRADTALIFSLNLIFYGISAPFIGAFVDRFGPRKTIAAGAFVLALGTLLCSLATELWHFYIFYGVLVAFGICALGYASHTPIFANWFIKYRGTALGIFGVGLGISFSMQSLTQHLIDGIGWRAAFIVLAALAGLIVLPLVAIFQRHKPQDMGLQPDGLNQRDGAAAARTAHEAMVVDKKWADTDWTLLRALKTHRLWLMFFGMLFIWGTFNLVLGHYVQFAVDMGYTKAFLDPVYFLFGIMYAAGSFFGFVSDRIGREATVVLGCIPALIGVLMLVLIRDVSTPWMLYVFAVCFGLGPGFLTPAMPAATADIFQGKHIGAIYGFTTLGVGTGGFIGPWLAGYIFDHLGTYTPAFIIALVGVVLCALSVWLAAPRKVRLVAGMAGKVQEAKQR